MQSHSGEEIADLGTACLWLDTDIVCRCRCDGRRSRQMTQYAKRPILLVRDSLEPDVYRGLLSECNSLGWRMVNLLYSDDYIPERGRIVGAILSREPPPKLVDKIRKRNIPIIDMTPAYQDLAHYDAQVSEDRRAAGCFAADFFRERGFENFGYVEFASHEKDILRTAYITRVEAEFGATVHVCRLPEETGRKADYHLQLRGLVEWLKKMSMPLGVFAYNHIMGIRITIACELAGLRVPEHIAVLCRGNNETQCDVAPVPLSAIDTNREQQARRAVQVLQQIIKGGAPPAEPILIPIKGVVERRSTEILAIGDERVAKAIRFIWDHLDSQIGVDDVAEGIGVSRKALERAFRVSLGRGINAELRRKRLEHCKNLLRTTSLPVSDILKAVGWSSRRYLHAAFKEAFGMTPSAYRKKHNANSEA